MTFKRRDFDSRLPNPPAAAPAVAAEPRPPTGPPPPAGPPHWLNGQSVEEFEYRRAVEKAFRPKPWEPEPDPFYEWLYGGE